MSNGRTITVDRDLLEKVFLGLRLAIKWKNFKLFCREHTHCGDCPHFQNKICTIATDETVLFKIAEVALEFFVKEGIPLTGTPSASSIDCTDVVEHV
jgi:hypothetical protein